MLKKGDKVLVLLPGEVTKEAERNYPARLKMALDDRTIYAGEDDCIPIPPPLSAPDGEGPWLHQWSPVCQWRARELYKRDGELGFWRDSEFITDLHGTWHRIPDIFGVEAEEKREPESEPKDPHDIAMKFIDGCVVAFSAACDNLIERLSTPPQPGGRRKLNTPREKP